MGALSLALVHYLGYVASSGQRRALGISALTMPTISERYILIGSGILISALITAIYLLVPVVIIFWASVKVFRRLSAQRRSLLKTAAKSKITFGLVFIAAMCVSVFGLGLMARFINHTDGVLLKAPSEVGRIWLRVSFDDDKGWIFCYQALFMGQLVSLILVSTWLIRNARNRPFFVLFYAAWSSILAFSLLGGYAFFIGATNTADEYPVVVFDNIETLIGSKKSLVVLLDSDEKLYALLVVFPEDVSNDKSHMRKAILYLPISQVKWLTVIKEMPLYDVVHYADINNLQPSEWPKP